MKSILHLEKINEILITRPIHPIAKLIKKRYKTYQKHVIEKEIDIRFVTYSLLLNYFDNHCLAFLKINECCKRDFERCYTCMYSRPKNEMNKIENNYYCFKCGCTFQLLKDFYKAYRFKSKRQINKLNLNLNYHFVEIKVSSIYKEDLEFRIYRNRFN